MASADQHHQRPKWFHLTHAIHREYPLAVQPAHISVLERLPPPLGMPAMDRHRADDLVILSRRICSKGALFKPLPKTG